MAERKSLAAGRVAALSALSLCTGCASRDFWLIHPRGPVAGAGLHFWIIDTAATFLVIGPTTLLVMWAIWRYRRATGRGSYKPGWSHSVPLEIVFWGFPLAIVIGSGYYSLRGAYGTNPAAPGVMQPGASADADKPPIDVDVVTTDWQWLFIYPKRHIAVANELEVPVDTPIRFRLTSATVATAFFIPQLVGQIDVMPGMRTRQGMIADRIGTYEGFATDFNGPGFSWMRFKAHIVSPTEFARWQTEVEQSPIHLDATEFTQFAQPTINKSGRTIAFSDVEEGLFDHVIDDVMMGRVFPTPPDMTEKKSHKVNGGREPTTNASPA